ncbi:MAG TPA: NAD(P)-dependent oxidoreductase, partial [Acidimicrobiales bacterium]|nr:NAD(P)-dependent oxidoreductase [Acidimicrobiales bacterium]
MQVFVTGGTGAIGRHAVPALVAAGHTVSALARTPDRAAALEAQGARPVAVSLFDRDGLALAFAGHDAVVNLATAIPPTSRFLRRSAWADNQRIRTEGSAAVVDAAVAAGVGRLVQESVAMVYPDRGAEWIDEDVAPDRYPMAEGNLAAEASARHFTAVGGTGVVLRLGWFHGAGAAHSEELLALARRHVATMIGPPDGFVSSIHVADGGAAVEAALAVPAGPWNVVDDEPLTKRAFADALAAAVGVTPWVRPPGRAALLLGDRTTSLTRS